MEYEKIKEIIKDMEESKLESLSIEFSDGTKVSMTKHTKGEIVPPPQEPRPHELPSREIAREVKEEIGEVVKSPIVGTFYAKSSPDAEPFVTVGSKVEKGDILCIIEAMKLMNEIESEYSGEVVEILVKDGDTVEYGTPLFRIKK